MRAPCPTAHRWFVLGGDYSAAVCRGRAHGAPADRGPPRHQRMPLAASQATEEEADGEEAEEAAEEERARTPWMITGFAW